MAYQTYASLLIFNKNPDATSPVYTEDQYAKINAWREDVGNAFKAAGLFFNKTKVNDDITTARYSGFQTEEAAIDFTKKYLIPDENNTPTTVDYFSALQEINLTHGKQNSIVHRIIIDNSDNSVINTIIPTTPL